MTTPHHPHKAAFHEPHTYGRIHGALGSCTTVMRTCARGLLNVSPPEKPNVQQRALHRLSPHCTCHSPYPMPRLCPRLCDCSEHTYTTTHTYTLLSITPTKPDATQHTPTTLSVVVRCRGSQCLLSVPSWTWAGGSRNCTWYAAVRGFEPSCISRTLPAPIHRPNNRRSAAVKPTPRPPHIHAHGVGTECFPWPCMGIRRERTRPCP